MNMAEAFVVTIVVYFAAETLVDYVPERFRFLFGVLVGGIVASVWWI